METPFDLPPGAQRLASSAVYPNQAFQVGPQVLALQFHIEAQARTFERWLIGHTAELGAAGLDVVTLRQQAQSPAPAWKWWPRRCWPIGCKV